MLRTTLLAISLLSLNACATVLSSAPTTQSANGDAWYTEVTGFAGLAFSSRVYYCPAPESGPATCKEAKYVEQAKK